MNIGQKLQTIMKRCNYQVTVTVNEHRNNDQTAKAHLEKLTDSDMLDSTPGNVIQKMIEKDTIICCQAYPKERDLFRASFHYDLNECLAKMLELLA